MNKRVLLAVITLIVIAIGIYFFASLNTTPQEPGRYNSFAQCLTDSGARMFGAFWCPHCQQQKESFGESWKNIEYVECSTANKGQTQQCINELVKIYPTWEFGDGKRVEGFLSFEQLSQYSSCPLPSVNNSPL